MDWSDNWRGAFRIELRAEAIGLACHGWPVVPGTYPHGDQWLGRDTTDAPQADGPAPVFDDWATRAPIESGDVAALWSDRPYTLLVGTGSVLDAVEVDANLGRRAAVALRAAGVQAPIAGTPAGRWLFLTAPSGRLPEPLALDGIRLHSTGSWIPVPPSPFLHGVVHWRVRPEVCGWRLPDPAAVHTALIDAVHGTPTSADADGTRVLTAGRAA